jgi:hypothetical protein
LPVSFGSAFFRYCWLSQLSLSKSKREAEWLTSSMRNSFFISSRLKISWSPCDQPRRTEVVHHRVGQVAGSRNSITPAAPWRLDSFGAVLVQDHRHVREARLGHAQRAVDVDLARRVVDVVVAADHVADLHVDVVDHDAKL